jgi:hypothetical protein
MNWPGGLSTVVSLGDTELYSLGFTPPVSVPPGRTAAWSSDPAQKKRKEEKR